jgi:PIN domain nuclease of toxin-antitoxin system
VVDSSVPLAVIHKERGWETISPELLARAIISAVNLAEVQGKLLDWGWRAHEAWADATDTVGEVAPFTADHAKTAGSLIEETRPFGLSLGDRACLALALALHAPVYAADRAWKKLRLGLKIHVIR